MYTYTVHGKYIYFNFLPCKFYCSSEKEKHSPLHRCSFYCCFIYRVSHRIFTLYFFVLDFLVFFVFFCNNIIIFLTCYLHAKENLLLRIITWNCLYAMSHIIVFDFWQVYPLLWNITLFLCCYKIDLFIVICMNESFT